MTVEEAKNSKGKKVRRISNGEHGGIKVGDTFIVEQVRWDGIMVSFNVHWHSIKRLELVSEVVDNYNIY
jgi:hypothetical protein